MKKILTAFFVCLVVLLANTSDASAATANWKGKLNYTPTYINKDIYDLAGMDIEKREGIYYLVGVGNNAIVINGVSEVANGKYMVLKTTYGKYSIESWYKYINKDDGNFLERNIVTYSSGDKVYKEDTYFPFYKDSCGGPENDEYVSDNCSDYGLKSMSKTISQNSKVISKEYYTFQDNAEYFYDFSSAVFYKLNSKGKLYHFEKVISPREEYSNASEKLTTITYYDNGIEKNRMTYVIDDYYENVTKFKYTGYTNVRKTNYNKVTYKVIQRQYYDKNDKRYNVKTYLEKNSYYANKNIKQKEIHKRNKTNKLTSSKKTIYRSNKKKISYKYRTYKSGKISKHISFKYNKQGNVKGNAYKIAVNFNKKGKATSAYKAKYSKKGKLGKAKKIKLKKSTYSW